MRINLKNTSLLLLFALSFSWFYMWGKGVFFYQENNTLFIWSIDYLQKFTSHPGGLLVWAGNFFVQGYFSPLFGALLVSALITAFAWIIHSIVRHSGRENAFSLILSLIPSFFMILLLSQYEYHFYYLLGLIFATVWFLASFSAGKKPYRYIFVALFPLLYYVTGAFSFIYAGAFLAHSLLFPSEKKYQVPSLALGYFILTYIVFRQLIFFQPDRMLLGYPMVFNENRTLSEINIFLGVLLAVFPAVIWLHDKVRNDSALLKYSVFMLFLLLTACLILQFKPEVSRVLNLEKSVHEQDWNSVIREYERSSSSNIVSQYFYDLALSETGQLCNRMFAGDQSSGPLALTLDGNRSQAFRTIYFYYCIGLINEAHHLAYENMVRHGYTPETIKMLVKTELLRGNYAVARNYLVIMEKTLHYRKWAAKYERMASDTSLIRKDPELGGKLRLMPREDFFIGSGDSRNIELLLKSNPDNRVAAEYRMAWSLLEKDVVAVSGDAVRLGYTGDKFLPRHVEEAIVAYRNVSSEAPADSVIRINPETEKRFFLYRKTLSAYNGNKTLLSQKMAKSEKNTFWYYMQFSKIKSDFLKNNLQAEKSIN